MPNVSCALANFMQLPNRVKLIIGLAAQAIALQGFPSSAEPIPEMAFARSDGLLSGHQQGIWHESPVISKVVDQLVIRNWTSLNNKDGVDWSSQITDIALDLASNKLSDYASKTIQKLPFVLTSSINVDIRTEGSTNIGGDALFKILDFGLKEDQSRDGLAFLHTKYTGSLSNGSTFNTGLGLRYLLREDLLAGVNSYWDYRTTDYSTSHSRFGVGGELFWNTFSLRNNWYIPGTGRSKFHLNDIEYYESVVPGWDIEVGYRLPFNPNIALFVRGFRWDYQRRNDNTGLQGTVAYQMTPHIRVDSWVSNETPANPTQPNGSLEHRQDIVFGLNFTLTANKVIYKPNDIESLLQQEMVEPVRRRYDVLLERWEVAQDPETPESFTNTVGGL